MICVFTMSHIRSVVQVVSFRRHNYLCPLSFMKYNIVTSTPSYKYATISRWTKELNQVSDTASYDVCAFEACQSTVLYLVWLVHAVPLMH